MRSPRAVVLAVALLALPALVMIQPVEALDSGSWTNVVPGVADSISRITSDGTNDKVGFSYKLTSAGTVGFSLFDAETTSIQTDDISGNATVLGWTRLAHGGGAVWHIFAEKDATTGWWYKSTDDGVTWALLGTFADVVVVGSDIDALGDLVVVVTITTESPAEARFYKSTSGGLPGGTGYSLSDNRGSPTVVGSERLAELNGVSVAIQTSTQLALALTQGDSDAAGLNPVISEVRSTDGGAFWTIPYTAEGGSTPRKIFSNTGSNHRVCGFAEVVADSADYYYFWASGPSSCVPTVWRNPTGSSGGAGGSTIGAFNSNQPVYSTTTNYRTQASITPSGQAVWTLPHTPTADNSADSYQTVYSATPVTGTSYTLVREVSIPPTGAGTNGANLVQSPTITASYAVLGYGNKGVGDRFEVDWQEVPPQFGGGLAASVAVTNLVGFDVDLTGSTAIARLGGNDVTTFAAGTLAQSATVVDSFCNRVEGVAALQSHVSFIRCDSGDGTDVLGITIASSTMGSPSFSDICENAGNFCFADLDDADLAGNDDIRIGLGVMRAFPFDYSKCSTSGLNHCDAAWAFSDSQGRVGVLTYRWVNNAVDRSAQDSVTIDPTASSSTSFCATQDADGKNYLYAANQNANPKGFRVDFDPGSTSVITGVDPLTPSMTQVWPGTSSTAGAVGIGCGEGAFTVGKPSQVTIWARGGTSPIHTQAVSSLKTAGLTMSDNGQWIAYADATGIKVLCAVAAGCPNSLTNTTAALGDSVFAASYPDAGTFQAIKMDGAGSNLWVATSTIIARYSIFEATTGADESYDPDLQPGAQPPAPTLGDTPALSEQGIFGSLVTGSSVMFGDVGGRLFVASLLILGFAGIGAGIGTVDGRVRQSGGGATIGILLGAVVGFTVTVATGVFPKEWAFVMVLVAVVGVIIWRALPGRD